MSLIIVRGSLIVVRMTLIVVRVSLIVERMSLVFARTPGCPVGTEAGSAQVFDAGQCLGYRGAVQLRLRKQSGRADRHCWRCGR